MFLTAAEAFAKKNSFPWLTVETKQLKHDLELCFKSMDAMPVQQFAKNADDMIPQSVEYDCSLSKEGRQISGTFAYWDTFLESGNILLLLLQADREANFPMHIQVVIEMVPYFILAGRVKYA